MGCLDILHAFIASIDPALTRPGYVASLTREQRMSELDGVAEDFLAAPLARVRTSPDGKLVFGGHGDDATLLDVVSHGFFHRLASKPLNGGSSSEPESVRVDSYPGKFHVKRRNHPTPLTNEQREHQEMVVASSPPVRDPGLASATRRSPGKSKHVRFKDEEEGEAGGSKGAPTPFTHALGVCHRLAVFDVDRDKTELTVTAIMSQLDIVRFLHRHSEALNHLRDMTLTELGLLTRREVVTAPWDSSALECFKLMTEHKVSAVGVVDREGELVANLSASDLRRLDERSFRLLALPVAEFISRRKGDAIGRRGAPFAEARKMETGERTRDPEVDVDIFRDDSDSSDASDCMARNSASRTFVELIFARAETTLSRLVALMATHSIHHVYVIDEDDAPIAVITPTDVLRLFVVDDEDCMWNLVWAPGQGVEEAMEARE